MEPTLDFDTPDIKYCIRGMVSNTKCATGASCNQSTAFRAPVTQGKALLLHHGKKKHPDLK